MFSYHQSAADGGAAVGHGSEEHEVEDTVAPLPSVTSVTSPVSASASGRMRGLTAVGREAKRAPEKLSESSYHIKELFDSTSSNT